MNKDAPDFGNPWADEDGSSGGFASSPEFENPWADASETGDATVSGTDATAATTGGDSAGSPDKSPGKKESSSGASKVSAILLAIALVIVGIWALSSNSSADEDIEYLERENARLSTEADKVPELESKIRALESDASDADSLEQQRDRLLAAFGGIDPCSITGFGTAKSTYWSNAPEKGLGCDYSQDDKRTLVVTIGTPDADSEDEAGSVKDVEGYYLSRANGGLTVFVWAPGSESEARQTASDVLDDLIG